MTRFAVDPAFDAGSVFVADWNLCHVRLEDDARFPWLILIPRVPGAIELSDLAVTERGLLMDETVRAGDVVRTLGLALGRPVEKLNVGAIGNITAQLHVHMVGRRRDDPLWPGPVWGRPGAERYDEVALEQVLSISRG